MVTYDPEDYEGGAVCGECLEPFMEGQPMVEQFMALSPDGLAVVCRVCVSCGLEHPVAT